MGLHLHCWSLGTDKQFHLTLYWIYDYLYMGSRYFQAGIGWARVGLECISSNCLWMMHSVESPSMVDPQWNIWYWGSKWNLHTVCWSAVGCEWGTTSVYFGITYVCFIPSRLPVLLLSPSTCFNIFYFCQKYHLNYTYNIFKKFHVGLKFEWGL